MENNILELAKTSFGKIDTEYIKEKAVDLGENISEKALEVKQATLEMKEDIVNKINELDNMLSQEITNYNDAYTIMNDYGMQLYVQRSKAAESLGYVETLVNSIANHPKEFDDDFEEISISRREFKSVCDFADQKLAAAREAATDSGAGLAAGATVACMGPTAAMWIATTFGTASTGTAISTLSGAAATNAALTWLGGGTLAAGGGGTVTGEALLALAGPIGWSIAGATLVTSIVLFAKKKNKLDKEKNEEIESVKKNTEAVKEISASISKLVDSTTKLGTELFNSYNTCFELSGADYTNLDENKKLMLGSLVNNAKSLSALLGETIESVK